MEMRENELHKAIQKTVWNEADYKFWTFFDCPVCGKRLCGTITPDDEKLMARYFPNYCPNCGARLER